MCHIRGPDHSKTIFSFPVPSLIPSLLCELLSLTRREADEAPTPAGWTLDLAATARCHTYTVAKEHLDSSQWASQLLYRLQSQFDFESWARPLDLQIQEYSMRALDFMTDKNEIKRRRFMKVTLHYWQLAKPMTASYEKRHPKWKFAAVTHVGLKYKFGGALSLHRWV